MILRYYSHYAFIWGVGFFKNYVVELKDGYLFDYFPFEKELAVTEFQSGLLIYIPEAVNFEKQDFLMKNPIMDNLIKEDAYQLRSFKSSVSR